MYFSPESIDLITFDFDGTLASLTIDFPALINDIKSKAGDFGIEWSKCDGMFLLEAVDYLERIYPVKGSEFKLLAYSMIESRELESALSAKLFPYTETALRILKQRGYKTAIITRNCRKAVEAVFPDIENKVDIFVPREDVTNPKPHPDHMFKVLNELDVSAERCLVVGDHPIDIETAHKVGAHSCGITTGRMKAEDMKHAELVCSSLNELVAEIT